MKKFLLWLMIGLICISSAWAQTLTACDEDDDVSASADMAYLNSTAQSIDFGTDDIYVSTINITPTDGFKMGPLCENFTMANGTTSELVWPGLDAGEGIVYNASSIVYVENVGTSGQEILIGANYSFDNTLGNINWNETNSTEWNNTLVSVCYNKTFTAITTDLFNLTIGYDEGTTGTYGGSKTFAIDTANTEIYNQNWTIEYTAGSRTCSARDSCEATKITIFAGLALLGVAIIVLSAFALIKLTSGDMTTTILGTIAVGVLALAITIMIGYYIISTVGLSICGAAIG